MDKGQVGSLSAPLEGWSHEEQHRPTAAGRSVTSDPLFLDGLGPAPMEQTRSNSDVMSRALTVAGAERVPLEDFWNLTELGESVAALRGRDIEVWALRQRPVRAYRQEFRMGSRLGEKASWELAQNPLMTLANTLPGIRLSSPRETAPSLASL